MIIEKIYAYLNDPKKINQESLSLVGELSQYAFARQFGNKEESERTLRLSSIGQCLRKQAYNVLSFPINGKEIDPRAKMVFFQGDMAELAILQLAKIAGCKIHHSGLEQKTVEIAGIKGHPDGILETDLQDYLIEVKSMSSYSFADFEAGEIDTGYLYQINAYLYALGLESCIVLALNKDAGVLSERIITANKEIQSDIISRIDTLKNVSVEKLPIPQYVPNEKGIYPWQCLYCPYHFTCKPTAKLKLIGRSNKLVETALQ